MMKKYSLFVKKCCQIWCVVILILLSVSSCTNQPPPPSISAITNSQEPTIPSPLSTTAEPLIPVPSTSTTPMLTVSSNPTAISTEDVIWEILNKVDKNRTLEDLRKITGEEPICDESGCQTITNRRTGSEGLNIVKKYISTELTNFGYSVELQKWSNLRYSDQNIIARKIGNELKNEEIYFVAHIDGIAKGDTVLYPAADDNASGVVDILELARVISSYSFKRTIIFIFSTGEEQGTLGIKHYLRHLSGEEQQAIKYVINVDMIGYDADQDRIIQLFRGSHSQSITLTETMSEVLQEYDLDLAPELIEGCG